MSRPEIDPQLPYVQMHRSVPHQAGLLAPLLDVTMQHAAGGLLLFFTGLADRRLLQDETGKAVKKELVLPEAEVALRLKRAFGKPVALEHFVGPFLEPRPGGHYRIRGASRLLNTEAGRLAKKRDKDTGERPGSYGGGTPVSPRSHPGGTPVSPRCHPDGTQGDTPVAPACHPGVTPQRREVRGESLKEKQVVAGFEGGQTGQPEAEEAQQPPPRASGIRPALKPDAPTVTRPTGERVAIAPNVVAAALAFQAWAQEERHRLRKGLGPDTYHLGLEDWYCRALTSHPSVTDERLREAWVDYLEDEWGRSRAPPWSFQVFMADACWQRYLGKPKSVVPRPRSANALR